MKCFITTIYPNNDKMEKTHMQEKKTEKELEEHIEELEEHAQIQRK